MKRDKVIFDLIEKEKKRQQDGIELIASENFTSPQVMKAMGTVLTNKYAEGLPGKRYYGGCEVVDQIEQLAIDRAKELFGAVWANVQPHSGAQANAAVMLACLKPGDKILGFDLSHGGHLTHGSPVNFSGKLYQPVFYGVERETETIDFRSEEHTSELQSRENLVCRLLLDDSYPTDLYTLSLHDALPISHSGAQANAAVMLACLKPGDKILGFDLSHGGHLTHGSPVNFSGKLYQPVFYGVERETETIDFDRVIEIAEREKPKLIICGASAYSRDWDYKKLREAADRAG